MMMSLLLLVTLTNKDQAPTCITSRFNIWNLKAAFYDVQISWFRCMYEASEVTDGFLVEVGLHQGGVAMVMTGWQIRSGGSFHGLLEQHSRCKKQTWRGGDMCDRGDYGKVKMEDEEVKKVQQFRSSDSSAQGSGKTGEVDSSSTPIHQSTFISY